MRSTRAATRASSAARRGPCHLPALPHAAEGEAVLERHFTIGREVWIEREDFAEVPPKGYKRLLPGNKVRLKGGYVIECTGAEKDADGNITKVLATMVPDAETQPVALIERADMGLYQAKENGRNRIGTA